jgi:hypothetical protein
MCSPRSCSGVLVLRIRAIPGARPKNFLKNKKLLLQLVIFIFKKLLSSRCAFYGLGFIFGLKYRVFVRAVVETGRGKKEVKKN